MDVGHMPGMFPVVSGGVQVWHMPSLVSIFGDDAVIRTAANGLGAAA